MGGDMTRMESEGICTICKSSFSKRGMTRHLQSCIEENLVKEKYSGAKTSLWRFFHLLVEGRYLPQYWLHLKVSNQARFSDLDSFLRDIWLECCGHLSAFRIGREDIKMSAKFEYTLQPGMILTHEYDFGTTTELSIRVVSKFESPPAKEYIQILARNDPPEIKCSFCDQPATLICTECKYSNGGWLCEDCTKTHECDKDLFLPVVNSPRTGECGYTGS